MVAAGNISPTIRNIAPRSHIMDANIAQTSPLQIPGGGSGGRSKKKVTSACLECRRARSKCSSSRPCARCQTLNIECIFNEGGDLRRRETRERRAHQLAQQQQMLEDLLQFMRQRSPFRINELISVVRHTQSNLDIHDWLRELQNDEAPLANTTEAGMEPLETVDSMSAASSSSAPGNAISQPRRHMLSLNELTEPRDEIMS